MTMIPIQIPSKIICVGRNYRAHAEEFGNVVPEEPLIFFKPPSSLIGSGEPIRVPEGVGRVDYEGEIGVLIGRRARKVPEAEALAHVSGVLPVNDVSARELQRKDAQWTRAKGFDTFCPVGAPVPAQELDLSALEVITIVNGQERQRAKASWMVFPIAHLVSYVSWVMTLEPGDLIATGTPEGVGPLAVGDRVVVEIPGVSRVENPVISDPPIHI